MPSEQVYDNLFNRYVFKLISLNSSCLDVGCWTGNLGKKLINNKRCIVDGIDCNHKAILKAKSVGYRNVFRINLNNEDYSLAPVNKKYDYIILADILEHLINPLGLLTTLKPKLKKSGTLIVSIPNVGFISLRLSHLLGRFDYSSKGGLMDDSHLRFFTKKTIIELIEKAGYEIVSFGSFGQLKKFIFMEFAFKIWPTVLGPQFIIEAKKQ